MVGVPAATEVASTQQSCASEPATGSASTDTETSVKAGSVAEPKVPIVCTGRTSDTFKLTTTPADHDTMRMCSDSKHTGVRINPAVIHSTGKPNASPDKADLNRVEPLSPAKIPQATGTLEPAYTEACLHSQTQLISKLKWCTSDLERTLHLAVSTHHGSWGSSEDTSTALCGHTSQNTV